MPILPPHLTIGYYTTEGQDINRGPILTQMGFDYIVILDTAGDPGDLGWAVPESKLSRGEA